MAGSPPAQTKPQTGILAFRCVLKS